MRILLVLSLLGLSNCASDSLLGCFSCGWEEGQREGAAFWKGMAIQAARHPDWAGPQNRTEEIKLIPQNQTVCVQAVDYFGRVAPCN